MPTCAGCRKSIMGEYVRVLGADWHRDCFRCAACGQPAGREGFIEHEGRAYHVACYHERFSPRCAACGKVITGKYTNALGKSWHVEHFVCAQCGKPFAGRSFFERDGKAYCETDFHLLFSPKCTVCGEPLRGTYSVNLWGDKYCERHNVELHKCYSCGRLICARLTGGGVRYQDGRHMCNLCRRTAVDAPAEGERIMGEVRRALASFGMDLGMARIPLRLPGQGELTSRSTHAYASDPSGMACTRLWTQRGRVVRREVEEILVLHGLPREHFSTVVAHELGHAWLFLNAFPKLPPQVEEGICELCEYLWLKRQGTREAQYRLTAMESNKDPVYGAGFKSARRALEGRTFHALLEYVRKYARFP
ncbi:MAG TPA: protein DA1 [Chloroflexia bacterium]|nr:protein DA1 [Chloroflexia bacterium]